MNERVNVHAYQRKQRRSVPTHKREQVSQPLPGIEANSQVLPMLAAPHTSNRAGISNPRFEQDILAALVKARRAARRGRSTTMASSWPGEPACNAMTCGDVRNADRPLGINETKMRLEMLQIAHTPLRIRAFPLVRYVVRDRIELSTFRFSG